MDSKSPTKSSETVRRGTRPYTSARFSKPPPSATRPQLRCGGYARGGRKPQATDSRSPDSGAVRPVGAPEFGFQVSFACSFCNSFWKTSLRNLARGRLYVACAGSFGNFLVATEGAPEVVPFLGGSLGICPLSSGRGEGAKMLSSVPGGHIWGHGGPAQHPRVTTCQTSLAKRPSLHHQQGSDASLMARGLSSARSVPPRQRGIPRSLAGIGRLQA